MSKIEEILKKYKSDKITMDEAKRMIYDVSKSNETSSNYTPPVQTKMMDDYEWNMHRHWRGETDPIDDYGTTFKKYQD